MKIERWFKAKQTCDTPGLDIKHIDMEPGEDDAVCLAVAFCRHPWEQLDAMTRIIRRHFSHRLTCSGCRFSPYDVLVHFNDHPETTREDIDKVLRIYTEEVEHALVL